VGLNGDAAVAFMVARSSLGEDFGNVRSNPQLKVYGFDNPTKPGFAANPPISGT